MNELTSFLIGVAVLILYLLFSALTEMGTKNPWKNDAEKSSTDEQTPPD